MASLPALSSILKSVESGYKATPATSRQEWLDSLGLTSEQRAAVTAPLTGNVVVKAAAGSGKTKVLTARAAYLLKQGVPADKILMCTFTRAAGNNMLERLRPLCGTVLRTPDCGTLHGHAFRCLGGSPGLTRMGLQLEADDEVLSFLIDTHREYLALPVGWQEKSPEQILLQLNRFYESKKKPEEWEPAVTAWEALLDAERLVTFSKLLALAPMMDTSLKYGYILVDEAQDLTDLQLRWIRRNLSDNGQIFAVGDDCQSIYAFRGTEAGLLFKLTKQKSWQTFELSTNFRCGSAIITLANYMTTSMQGGLVMKGAGTRKGAAAIHRFESKDAELLAMKDYFSRNPEAMALVRSNQAADFLKKKGIAAKTIHSSKGEEFDKVWVPHCEEGVLPLPHGIPTEEARLFYVALTRAESELTLSWSSSKINAKGKLIENKPSRFLFTLNGL